MDHYERAGYGREAAPASRRSPPGYQYYHGREPELDPYGPPRMEGRDLLSASRDRQIDPYGPVQMDRRDLLSSGREHGRENELDPYGPPRMEGRDLLSAGRDGDRHDLLSSGREHDLHSYRTRTERWDLISSGREHDLDSYRPRMEGRDSLTSGRDHELESYRALRMEGRALLSPGRYDDHNRDIPAVSAGWRERDPLIGGRDLFRDKNDDHNRDIPAVSAGWRERDPLIGGKDLFRDKTINGTGGMHANNFRGTGLGIGSKRVSSASFDDSPVIGSGARFDRGMGSIQGTLGRDGHGRDISPTGGGADSALEPILFIDGLPLDCTGREAAHIFRPFIGFKEVRVVHKEPKRPGGEKTVLCFVEFADSRHASIAREALQGYKIDEQDPDSQTLRISFSRYSGRKGSHYEDQRGGRHPNRGYRA